MMIKSLSTIFRKHYPIVIFLLIYVSIFGYKLISNPQPFYDWDESIYAEVGREMMETKSFVPLWQHQTWLDKPPLVPLFYGVIMQTLPFISPEVSTRIATLILATIALGFVYMLYYRFMKDPWFCTLVVMATSFTSIILQRSLVLNIDIFLLVGWLGYVLFYDRYWWSLGFLAIAVLSKSLIGFYAPAIMAVYFLYLFIVKKIDKKELIEEAKKIGAHVGIMLTWYLVMLIVFGKAFWIQHIYESHMKRVTASIESHFGKRTYYIELLSEYFGKWAWISVIGLGLLIWKWWKKQIKNLELLYAFFLFPWFLFLNLTKTKIFWYSHPYIPQFVFLILYPVTLLKKINVKLYSVAIAILFIAIAHYYLVKQQVYNVAFSTHEPHHDLAEYAAQQCDNLFMLMSPTEREKIATLKSMDLTITTTTWWGEHPSMVYYYGKKIDFVYDVKQFNDMTMKPNPKTCVTVSREDLPLIKEKPQYRPIKDFGTVYLYQAQVQ